MFILKRVLNLQAEYDVRIAKRELLPKIKGRIRPLEYHAS